MLARTRLMSYGFIIASSWFYQVFNVHSLIGTALDPITKHKVYWFLAIVGWLVTSKASWCLFIIEKLCIVVPYFLKYLNSRSSMELLSLNIHDGLRLLKHLKLQNVQNESSIRFQLEMITPLVQEKTMGQ